MSFSLPYKHKETTQKLISFYCREKMGLSYCFSIITDAVLEHSKVAVYLSPFGKPTGMIK